MHPYGLNLDEWIKWWPNGSLFSRLRFFEGTQLNPTSRGELNWLKTHVSGWAQTSFAQAEYAAKRKTTRRERFLAEMEQIVHWARLLKALALGIIKTRKAGADGHRSPRNGCCACILFSSGTP